LLRAELQHRTKNLLALISSLAHQTFQGDLAIETARNAFIARLTSMARASETIGAAGADPVSMALLVQSALRSFPERVCCVGEEAYVNSVTARNLSLALHELATNSVKYGALSAPSGAVQVSWQAAKPGGPLNFVWRERGGPPVVPPTRRGFGSKLLESLFDKGEMQFVNDGIIYRVHVPATVALRAHEQH
jgi:two-component sensor histidine kinase